MEKDLLDKLQGKRILVTGGAGFIGSNLCEFLLKHGATVRCMDNLATGHEKNIKQLVDHPSFKFIQGDIRNLTDCQNAVKGMDYVLHQAALGSVPRSINDPVTTNDVNVGGFLNMLVASKESTIQRFIYAASSSTYGDSESLPKIEDTIGAPLSPYAITKYVNELYADVFFKTYGLDCIGLRYFNVFGPKQDPNGSYAAVIPKFTKALMSHESPIINGDGTFSRDFTYVVNVIEANVRSLLVDSREALNKVYNVACSQRTSLNELLIYIQKELCIFDETIGAIKPVYGDERLGDVPHSLASIDRAKKLLGYNPQYTIEKGLKEAMSWYWENLKAT